MKIRYLIVVDFEANCVEDGKLKKQEITEFPALPICVKTNTILYEKTFHHYCKIDEKLTEFATELTGITQDMCDGGLPFAEVLKLFQKWLKTNRFNKENSIIVTCGHWDFKKAFPTQCLISRVDVPKYCQKWVNVKEIFENAYKTKPRGLVGMLEKLGMEFEGRHHSGIDDVKNLAKICVKMQKEKGNLFT